MLTTDEWNNFMSPEAKFPPRMLKKRVRKEVREYLSTLAPGITISTHELGEALYPQAVAVQTLRGDMTRHKIFEIIGKLANDGLDDCCVKGPVNGKFMGKPKRPWLWFCPPDEKICPTCGQDLPVEEENT